MTVISKLALAPSVTCTARILTANLQPARILVCDVRNSHGHVFRKRKGQLYINRVKDIAHFYLIGIGFLPVAIILFVVHVVFGPCRLEDYPTEGPPPHYWQFERTPLRQWYAKWIGVSDMEQFERNLALYERNSILSRWRRIEARVKHLQGERWDYKGYYYQPVSTTWIDYARKAAERTALQYEEHGHSTI